MVQSTLSGRIAYLSGDGRETGRERFDLITQDGGITLRAFCEMDEVALSRDVTLSMDRKWQPLDGFCRLTRRGRREAAMWFDVGQHEIRLTNWVADGPSEIGKLPLDTPLVYLGLHPLQGDALIVNARGVDRIGDFVAIDAMTNSISPDGDNAVGLRRVTIDVAYVGKEVVTVAAGQFLARRYALRWDPKWPAANLWVREHDCVFVQMEWSFADARYELVELIETFAERTPKGHQA
jgi:hypothetical protein